MGYWCLKETRIVGDETAAPPVAERYPNGWITLFRCRVQTVSLAQGWRIQAEIEGRDADLTDSQHAQGQQDNDQMQGKAAKDRTVAGIGTEPVGHAIPRDLEQRSRFNPIEERTNAL